MLRQRADEPERLARDVAIDHVDQAALLRRLDDADRRVELAVLAELPHEHLEVRAVGRAPRPA